MRWSAGEENETERQLAAVRPGLVEPFRAALPGARAAVMSRLWRALAFEPLPWIAGREHTADGLEVRLTDGRVLHGPPADPFAVDGAAPGVAPAGARPGLFVGMSAGMSAGMSVGMSAGASADVRYDDPAALVDALAVPHGKAFAAELAGGVASLALSRADAAPPRDGVPTGPSWEWEQRVVDGHPYHPGCRSRPGFTVAEELAYAPEHRPVVRLGLTPVARDRCLVSGDWPAEWRDAERLLLPVHPWQARHVLRLPEGHGDGVAAHPLMALRTLAVPGGPQVKTSLTTRLTSSVRDISVGSVTSSAAVSAFAASLTPRLDGLVHVTRTLGAACDGSADLAAVVREAPEVYAGAGERVLPVAAAPAAGVTRSASWLEEFTLLALRAGLRLLELGVALEAHGQNLLVVLSPEGRPVRLVYRDLADIRVSPARLARHGLRLPEGVPRRIVTDDVTALRRKLFGSLVAGALGAAAGSAQVMGALLHRAAPHLPSGPDREALLRDPLPTKALTLMRLSPDRPGDLWTDLPNPAAWGGRWDDPPQ